MMQNIISWFRERISGRSHEDELAKAAVRVRPPSERPNARPAEPRPPEQPRKPDLRFDSDLGGRIEDAGPGKNVLVRSKYLREDTGTHDALKIIDESEIEEDDGGIDPYNTGRFDRSQSWNSRFRK